MSKAEDRLRDWVSAVAGPTTTMVSWIALGYPTNPNGGGRTMMDDYVMVRGLDPARQLCRGQSQLVAAITDRQLLIGDVGGVFVVKPKDLLVDVPLADCRVEWWDQAQVGPDQRHLLITVGSEWVRTSARIDERSNADAFIAALGPRALHVDP